MSDLRKRIMREAKSICGSGAHGLGLPCEGCAEATDAILALVWDKIDALPTINLVVAPSPASPWLMKNNLRALFTKEEAP